MSIFEYQALTTAGRLMKGTVEAGSAGQAAELLREMQLTVNEVSQAATPKIKTPVGRNTFLLFNQQLASITRAGIPLERGLRELANDISSRSMRKLVNEIAGDLEAGMPIEEAFQKREKYFPPLYGRILKAGVETGRLSEMLVSLNRQLEVTNQTRRIVFEAIAYPLVVLGIAVVIMLFLFTFLIPQFRNIYNDFDTQLPALTEAILSISYHSLPIGAGLGVFILLILGISAILSCFSWGKRFKERLYLAIPVFGRLYHNGLLSRMAETMALLIDAGCDMPTCIRLAASATGSERLKAESELLAGQVERGNNIIEAGQSCSFIPRLFFYSIQLGSQRNELKDNLYSLADMYAHQVLCYQARLQAGLLPVVLILVGGFIGLTVIGLFLPMISLIQGVSGGK